MEKLNNCYISKMVAKIKTKLFSFIEVLSEEIGNINYIECKIEKNADHYNVKLTCNDDISKTYIRKISFNKPKRKIHPNSLKNLKINVLK